jgi:hypothetical protein
MLVIAVLLPFVRIGRHAAVGQADKPVMGAFAQAPMRSRHPTARVRNDTTHRVDGSRQGQQIHVRHTEGQTQRAVPGTSSLVYGNWPAQVLPGTARRGEDRQTFRLRHGRWAFVDRIPQTWST